MRSEVQGKGEGWRPFKDGRVGLIASAALGTAVGILLYGGGLALKPSLMAAVAIFMAVCWVLEFVPIPVTSLFPLVLFPAFGIGTLGGVAANYGKPTIFLFLGGFLLALGLQRSRVHKRIALLIVSTIGSKPSMLVLGFMLASAVLSMWISNTASVLMMMPIGLAVLKQAKEAGVPTASVAKLGTAMMLAIAYAADIGGMATPVGTPPNLVLLELYQELTPGQATLGFGQWMMMGIPLSILFLGSGWLLLVKVLFRFPATALLGGGELIRDELKGLGPVRRDEVVTGLLFAGTALAWMTGADFHFGDTVVSGWRSLLRMPGVGDASVAIASASLLFAIPSKEHEGEALLTWESTTEVPWGLLLLFGGGFALASGFKESGLSAAIGNGMQGLAGLHPVLVVVIVCLVITFLTEFTSNTATTTLMLPILAQAADGLGLHPVLLMVPATLSASCAFMMPIASPTQAIVFGSGYVSIRQMMRAGIGFNLLGVLLVSIIFLLLAGPVFGVSY